MTPNTAFAPVRFSTRDLPERERLPRWREEFGRGLVSVDIEPVSSSEPFHAEAILQALPGVRTAVCTGSAARFDRTRAMAASGDDSVGLVVNLGPKAAVSQHGQDVALETGDAFPIFTDAAAVLTSSNHLGILLPRAPLVGRVADLDRAAGRAIPHDNEALRLLTHYLRLVREDFALGLPEIGQAVASHIHDLAALVLGASRDTAQDGGLTAVAAARLRAMKDDIRKAFTDPYLSVHTIAAQYGVSARYVQRIFEDSGSTFTQYVTEHRLTAAHKALRRRPPTGAPISSIAYDCGFADVSHFNRLFRQRFGCTPSDVRHAARSRND
ncbi:helix-turn-helix transcriptional regulator [Rhodoplanes sp. Z2-YC6860]|uniref:helix-turn-helix transcriptional regulator n=1 Tax=Rhodoplanes sp. Z2-YC6860 TaxID=674703 RepID=UPI00078EE065|nr:AraC family transcriptional regulator [Rhodoplanes sp. Z2-YC6860]AMN41547.1 AraC family transcriptional regulator [Rhodoplanes sp. Z2-YC6860]